MATETMEPPVEKEPAVSEQVVKKMEAEAQKKAGDTTKTPDVGGHGEEKKGPWPARALMGTLWSGFGLITTGVFLFRKLHQGYTWLAGKTEKGDFKLPKGGGGHGGDHGGGHGDHGGGHGGGHGH